EQAILHGAHVWGVVAAAAADRAADRQRGTRRRDGVGVVLGIALAGARGGGCGRAARRRGGRGRGSRGRGGRGRGGRGLAEPLAEAHRVVLPVPRLAPVGEPPVRFAAEEHPLVDRRLVHVHQVAERPGACFGV